MSRAWKPASVPMLPPVEPTAPGSKTSRSAPASTRATSLIDLDAPMCPSCKDPTREKVHKVLYLTAQATWLWQCSKEPTSSNGTGHAFCGDFFFEGMPSTTCLKCHTPLMPWPHIHGAGWACRTCRVAATAAGGVRLLF